MKKVLKLVLFLFLSWSFLHSIIVSVDGLSDDYVTSDVAIVLGSKVNKNGEPSDRLRARLDMAKDLYNDSIVKYILVSGGFGKEEYDEASVMRDYLIDNEIPAEFIVVDSDGNNTYLTASNFIEINKTYHFKSVVIVSQFFHLSRTKLIFRKFGFKKLSTAHAKYFEWRDVYSLLREFPAYYKYLFLSNKKTPN